MVAVEIVNIYKSIFAHASFHYTRENQLTSDVCDGVCAITHYYPIQT
jgi:hypothetical protein